LGASSILELKLKQGSISLTKEVSLYLFLTFSLSSIFYYLISLYDNGWLTFGLMWCPGVASIITYLMVNKTLKGFYLGFGKISYLIFSFLIPIISLFIVYGAIWVTDIGSFKGFEANFITKLSLVPMMLLILEGSFYSGRSALGEEIGWRGYLTPRLLQKYTPNQVSLFVGIIWSTWHFPLIISGSYGTDTPVLFQLTCFTLMLTGNTYIYTWFRIKSGSLWTGCLIHTSHNLFIFHVFNDLTNHNKEITPYFIDETGVMFATYGLVLILLFQKFGWDWPSSIKRHIRF
jgi:membrane protease YdiL (CAAX protease family)